MNKNPSLESGSMNKSCNFIKLILNSFYKMQ